MIAQTYLNELTTYTNTKIAKVVLNDTVEITSFLLKSTTDNVLTIEYLVLMGTVATVTKMELKSSAGAVVSTRTVNVPIIEDTIMRHVITLEEVV
ncbi:ketopantoate hydroxymethyltransferase [Cohnella silvisoli]|uniref:Ketopantoate hydroxymethyltransferase n=1 Tax=Cohnella silvisoli TaxID=2873699 RepID=A0ABV1L315_9BACL|nr:ketopantoate hydroxymethyltransferase [Cohnella silvisoli]MCD9026059.1 ketopantoate hydroxymethyltransferase [Cohnella silvisoli]